MFAVYRDKSSVFHRSVLATFSGLNRDTLWGRVCSKGKWAAIGWHAASKPMELGGVGVRCSSVWLALMGIRKEENQAFDRIGFMSKDRFLVMVLWKRLISLQDELKNLEFECENVLFYGYGFGNDGGCFVLRWWSSIQ
ncbi:hypothetical protein Ancab_022735, partial [Ancistrocladus abbreviatus]